MSSKRALKTPIDIDIKWVLNTAEKYGGSVTISPQYKNEQRIPLKEYVYPTCSANHKWSVTVECLDQWCTICAIINSNTSHELYCAKTQYTFEETKFAFICKQNHRTIIDRKTSTHGCRSCHLLDIAKKSGDMNLDIYKTNIDESTLLRFHCNKMRHNPKCTNLNCRVSSMREYCPDKIRCDQDFYASSKHIKHSKDVFNCNENHKCDSTGVITTIHVFETIYQRRFDDQIDDILFTGYNKDLSIAFVHHNDIYAYKQLESINKWCMLNNIILIQIPSLIKQMKQIVSVVVMQLAQHGEINTDITTATNNTISDMVRLSALGKLLEDRCILDTSKTHMECLKYFDSIISWATIMNDPEMVQLVNSVLIQDSSDTANSDSQ